MKYHSSVRLSVIGRHVCPCEIISLYQARLFQLMLEIQTLLWTHVESDRMHQGRVMYSLRMSRSQNTQSRE